MSNENIGTLMSEKQKSRMVAPAPKLSEFGVTLSEYAIARIKLEGFYAVMRLVVVSPMASNRCEGPGGEGLPYRLQQLRMQGLAVEKLDDPLFDNAWAIAGPLESLRNVAQYLIYACEIPTYYTEIIGGMEPFSSLFMYDARKPFLQTIGAHYSKDDDPIDSMISLFEND